MKTYICLLRAVNVGGSGKLPMADLRALCTKAGFAKVRRHIASGNLLLCSGSDAKQVKATLETVLADYAGKPVGVIVRTRAKMAAVLEANPFAKAPGSRCLAIFLDAPPPAEALATVSSRQDERLALGTQEIYAHYRDGIAGSKLKIAASTVGTARNMNTIAKLVAMASSDLATT